MTKCIWHGQVGNKQGYGTATYQGKTCGLHRKVYAKYNNVTLDSLKGFVIRHTCDKPRCINPEHLVVGTHADNTQDMLERKRSPVGALHSGAVLTNREVLDIREQYKPRTKHGSQRALGHKFNVSPSTIHKIVNNLSWRHV